MSKQQFLAKPKYQGLSNKEKEARWRQYKSSIVMGRPTAGRTRSTKISVRKTKSGKDVMRLGLTQCAAHYLTTLVAPFGFHGDACIPDLHAVPSKKVRVKARGTFSTGTTGSGFFVCSPWCNGNVDDTFLYTQSSYTPPPGPPAIIPSLPAPAGVESSAFAKLPYSSADFAANTGSLGVRARTVATGIRIRYIGPELARSGQIIGFRHPDNNNVLGLPYNSLRSLETSKTFTNKRQWIYANYVPVRPEEYRYSPNACTASDGNNYKWTMGFAIEQTTTSGGQPGPAPFEWEAIKFVEHIGNIDNITRTHTDIQGMSHVRNSLPEKSVHDSLMGVAHHVLSKVGESLKEAAPVVGAGMLAHHMLGGTAEAETAAAEAAASDLPLLEYLPQGVSTAVRGALPAIESWVAPALGAAEELAPLMLAL